MSKENGRVWVVKIGDLYVDRFDGACGFMLYDVPPHRFLWERQAVGIADMIRKCWSINEVRAVEMKT